MDQDILTNGALGAMCQKGYLQTSSLQQHQPLSPPTTTTTTTTTMCSGQKRSADWPPILSKSSPKQLKDMAAEFTASQIELAMRGAVVASSINPGNSCTAPGGGAGLAQSINLLMMSQNLLPSASASAKSDGVSMNSSASAVKPDIQQQLEKHQQQQQLIPQQQQIPLPLPLPLPQQQVQFQQQQQQWMVPQQPQSSVSGIDMSWLDPTPIKELNGISAERNSSNNVSILRSGAQEMINTPPSSFQLIPEKVKSQYISNTPLANEPSLLHRSLKLFSSNFDLVKGALDLNPQDIRRKAPLPKEAGGSGSSASQGADAAKQQKSFVIKMTSTSPESYGYPLNIAIQENASLEVLQLLVSAAPEVITCRDGRDECGSLSIVLRRPARTLLYQLQVMHMLIKANPMCLRMTDRRRNTPLHVALASPTTNSSLHVVKALCMLYPDALLQTNLNGETPLQIVQRQTSCGAEDVLNYIQDAYYQQVVKNSNKRGDTHDA